MEHLSMTRAKPLLYHHLLSYWNRSCSPCEKKLRMTVMAPYEFARARNKAGLLITILATWIGLIIIEGFPVHCPIL